jgi:primosomal protein N'
MLFLGRWLRKAAVCTAWIAVAALAQSALAAPREFLNTRPSMEARSLVDWAMRTGDPQGRPFVVVDKRAAHMYVFRADGQLAGHTPALLGSTLGDHTVPGVGARAQSGFVGPDERTTPAGRFEAAPGENAKGEHVVWVDYESAFAIHRLRPGFAYQARTTRMGTTSAGDKRVSWGCVVVPVAFYQQVVEKVLGRSRSVVYVMPETASLQKVFHALDQR